MIMRRDKLSIPKLLQTTLYMRIRLQSKTHLSSTYGSNKSKHAVKSLANNARRAQKSVFLSLYESFSILSVLYIREKSLRLLREPTRRDMAYTTCPCRLRVPI